MPIFPLCADTFASGGTTHEGKEVMYQSNLYQVIEERLEQHRKVGAGLDQEVEQIEKRLIECQATLAQLIGKRTEVGLLERELAEILDGQDAKAGETTVDSKGHDVSSNSSDRDPLYEALPRNQSAAMTVKDLQKASQRNGLDVKEIRIYKKLRRLEEQGLAARVKQKKRHLWYRKGTKMACQE